MKIAVLTMTRDRLDYTKHCFASLQANAGCSYDHYVLDQGSEDGTEQWLDCEYDAGRITAYTILSDNIGICRGLNLMLDEDLNADDYDVIVRFDNDCEVTQPFTLRTITELSAEYGAIVSPHVKGLRNPPPILQRQTFREGFTLSSVHHVGGIFMAIPSKVFSDHEYRYDETQPPWCGDELVCPWWAIRGEPVGYLDGWEVNHYLTTDGQAEDIPAYFQRRVLEGGPAK